MEWLVNLFASAQQALFEHVVGPLTFAMGLGQLMEDAFDATGWLLVGLLQIAVLLTVIGPLQRWRPAEPVTDRATVRTDMLYTAIHRLGVMRLVLFFTLTPLTDEVFSWWRVQGLGTLHLDDVWPGVTDIALVSFFIYLLLFDFIDYWMHRAQHQWHWWWQLHALHHAQRQMTMWSDNRNHLIDDLIRDLVWVVVAQLVGVPPAQFVALVAFAQLSESLQHANLRLWFGTVGERLWVSPRFHRLHHTIGIGHETQVTSVGAMSAAGPSQGAKAPSGGSDVHEVTSVGARLGGHNFGVLLPWWDMLFGTANFELRYDPTGVRDQVEQGRDYGRGFWSQQWLGVLRLMGKA
jgi:sterol desaturase/sphingolipid hydroxylase (fatty acid hydroxylase superfamily)